MSKNVTRILLYIGGFIALIVLMRFGAWVIRVLVVLAAAGLAGWLIYQLVQYLLDPSSARRGKQTLEGEIEKRLAYCRTEWEANQKEIKEIENHILEITDMDPEGGMGQKNLSDRDRLLQGFRREWEMRKAKAEFFESAILKLEKLSHNQRVARRLEEKRKTLESLQEEHYEDLADLEDLKTQTELDVLHLRTIEELSSQMMISESRDEALRLRRELETLTSDLRKL